MWIVMTKIRIRKAERLKGNIAIQGSKNTVLPIMAATLLSCGVSVIYNCPAIEDVSVMCQLLECLNVKTQMQDNTLWIDTTRAEYAPLPAELTTKLRSSVLLLGPMLARWQRVELGLPGGCAIGLRPIDIHLQGFLKMNIDIQVVEDKVLGKSYYLQGGVIQLRFPSVGATENLIMTAVAAKGRTILRGAAKEPEIIELCNYLISMGALIEGVGTDTLLIKGTKELTSSDYCNVYDRIVAGTYLLMASAIPSEIRLTGIDDIHYIKNVINVTARLGVNVIRRDNALLISSMGQVQGGEFRTGIYPEFPTDLLPVLITVLAQAKKYSRIEETIFENRFSIVRELNKLGATCEVDDGIVRTGGEVELKGTTLCATDLRQGAALVVAGMLSDGTTLVTNIEYIQRGYEDIVRDLQRIGVQAEYV